MASELSESRKRPRERPPEYQVRPLIAGQRCLVLGDGDLSWSLGTARVLAGQGEPALVAAAGEGLRFTATTWDSLEQLRTKYGADRVDPTIAALKACSPNVEVLHEVDATRPPKAVTT